MSQELQIPDEIDLAAFISKEAHDLKSPFNRTLGFIKLVLEDFDGPISDQAKEDLTVAYQNTQYTVMMMESLVEIARLKRAENNPILVVHPLKIILQQTISEWRRKYHKKNLVEVRFSDQEVNICADEIMIRKLFFHWISYVNEFVNESAVINIQVEEQQKTCLFTIRSKGTKRREPPECDLTLYGFIAKGILELHQGELCRIVEDDHGALVQFSLPSVS